MESLKMWKVILILLSLQQSYSTPQQAKHDFNGAFSGAYDQGLWNKFGGPKSGPGSDPCITFPYLTYLQHLISNPFVHKIVEIGFGDWEIMQHLILDGKNYIGYEVVKSIIRKSEFNTQYRWISQLSQIEESGDLLLVRDVMFDHPTHSKITNVSKSNSIFKPNFEIVEVFEDCSDCFQKVILRKLLDRNKYAKYSKVNVSSFRIRHDALVCFSMQLPFFIDFLCTFKAILPFSEKKKILIIIHMYLFQQITQMIPILFKNIFSLSSYCFSSCLLLSCQSNDYTLQEYKDIKAGDYRAINLQKISSISKVIELGNKYVQLIVNDKFQIA